MKLVFLCSPNNPTGNVIDRAAVLTLAAALAGRALLVIDEAYVEFAGKPSLAAELRTTPGLVVLRTLSKAHGTGRCALRRSAGPSAGHRAAAAGHPALRGLAADDRGRVSSARAGGARRSARARAACHRANVTASRLRWPRAARCAAFGRARRISCWSISPTPAPHCSAARAAGLLVRDLRHLPSLPQVAAHQRRHARAKRSPAGGVAMTPLPTLFIDRDGTLIEEPADEQVDSLDKIRFMPGVFAALARVASCRLSPGHGEQPGRPGHRIVSSRKTSSAARISCCAAFHRKASTSMPSCICPHRAGDGCSCRKPQTGMLREWLSTHALDASRSAVIGDRDTDMEFAANLGCARLPRTAARRRA